VNLIYINNELSSVFSSQVLALLNQYQTSGNFEKIVLICGYRNQNEKNKLEKLLASTTFKILFFKTYPNYPVFNFIQQLSIKRTIGQLKPIRKNTLVHIRGEMAAMLAAPAIKKHLGTLDLTLVDIRGAAREELLEFQSSNKIIRKIKLVGIDLSYRNLYRFKHISVVSESLKDYVNKKCSQLNAQVYINPCLASNAFTFSYTQRQTARKKLGLDDNIMLLVFSSGGTAGWQNNSEIAVIDKKLKILNLSKIEIKQDNVINRFVTYKEMPDYLFAADAAVIFRSKSYVNKVASPVKFSEYVCAGLPVISNGNVDQIIDFIESNDCGILINRSEEITETLLKELMKLPKETISKKGTDIYGIDKVAETYINIYNKMSGL